MSDHIEAILVERPDRLKLCKFDELVHRAPAPWQIRGVLREQSVSLLYGRRGCYKSFVALDLAASLATGLPWQSHDILTPGLVIYVAGEGGGGMVQRARAWAEQHSVQPRAVNMLFITEPVIVTATSEDMDVLIYRIKEAIDWRPAGDVDYEYGHIYETEVAREWPVLVVIDTLARCFVGSENDSESMGNFVQGLDRLKREFNCSVLVVHHTGRDESHERGHTSLPGACDTIYRMDADTEKQRLTLSNEKMKDGREPDPMWFSYREVDVKRRPDDDPNEELTSVIIEPLKSMPRKVQKARNVTDMLEFLTIKGSLSWDEWFSPMNALGMSKSAFCRYLAGLRENGQIVKKNGLWEVS